jgi:hypothetical protein
MRFGLVPFLVLVIAAPVRSVWPDDANLEDLLSGFELRPRYRGSRDRERGLGPILPSLLQSGKGFSEVVRGLEKRLDVPAPAASALLRAYLLEKRLESLPSIDEKLDAGEVAKIEAFYLDAFRRAPECPAVIEEIARFYQDRSQAFFKDHPRRLLELIKASPSPGRSAFLAWSPTDRDPGLLGIALEKLPGNAAVLEAVADQSEEILLAAALRGEALRRPVPSHRVAACLAGNRLQYLLHAGLTARACREYGALDPEVARIILESPIEFVEADTEGLPGRWTWADVRIDMAAAFILEGDREKAEMVLAALPAPGTMGEIEKAESLGDMLRVLREGILGEDELSNALQLFKPDARAWEHRRTDHLVRLARSVLAGAPPDPSPPMKGEERYPDLFDFIGQAASFANGTATRFLLCRLLDREGYRDPAGRIFEEARRALRKAACDEIRDAFVYPAPVIEEFSRLREEVREVLARVEGEIAARRKGPGDPMAATVDRLLHSPPIQPFAEKVFTPETETDDEDGGDPDGRISRAARGLRFPQGFGPVRIWRDGSRLAALGGLGAHGPGGLWLILSTDDGRSWSRPIFIGIGRSDSYEPFQPSKIPLIRGEILEAEVRITDFPPGSMGPRLPEKGVLLEAPIASLEADSDGDGLPDLVEESLLTDPSSRDTDGDGLEDARDSLPQVSLEGGGGDEAEAVALALERIIHGSSPAVVRGRPEPGQGLLEPAGGVGTPWGRTVLLSADRTLLRAITLRVRTVVLAPDEWRARWRIGRMAQNTIGFPIIDPAGRRCRIVFGSSYGSGAIELAKKDGKWSVSKQEGEEQGGRFRSYRGNFAPIPDEIDYEPDFVPFEE